MSFQCLLVFISLKNTVYLRLISTTSRYYAWMRNKVILFQAKMQIIAQFHRNIFTKNWYPPTLLVHFTQDDLETLKAIRRTKSFRNCITDTLTHATSPGMKRRNSTGTIYLGTTMSAQDNQVELKWSFECCLLWFHSMCCVSLLIIVIEINDHTHCFSPLMYYALISALSVLLIHISPSLSFLI